ncbi:hypothetical protein [Nocardioides sp. SYSU D00038]|uniref:hypothetical protein n=1 Tax=Nocardioides sp. SYSU D00038 TaxID=2812554 RepID=UPI001968A1CE|nr:hypothetical protein [Nocardioides sp. SYSU D00038]
MTTDQPRDTRHGVVRVLVGAVAAATLATLVAVLLAATRADAAAVRGALAGGAMAVVVFSLGAFFVNAVARLMPALSLLLALLTYTLQVVVMAAFFVALSRGGALGDTLDRQWLGGTVIAATAAWLVGQVVLTTRLRIPVYELAGQGGER